MKPKWRGWKEGTMSEDLRSFEGSIHRKGSTVRYKRHKVYDSDGLATGEYEWHYLNTDNYNLIRERKLLIIEEQK